MNYASLVSHYGGLSKAAEALELDRRTVHAWSKRRIPSKWQVKVEVLTDGKLRADRDARREATEIAQLARQLLWKPA